MTVTETEWMGCTEPEKMLEFIQGRASDRKLRLFAAACSRSVWHLLTDERSRRAVEVAERYSDGLVAESERHAADRSAFIARQHVNVPGKPGFLIYASAAAHFSVVLTEGFAGVAADQAVEAAWSAGPRTDQFCEAACAAQGAMLRCILDNPFRPITISPAVLAWHDSTVDRLAQAAYDERHLPSGLLDTGRLAVLADALEEAGCMDADILGHLRGPGPHVRGCWTVDLCLGKE